MHDPFPGYLVQATPNGVKASVEQLSIEQLPTHEVTIAVEYSSLNFKDALASQGHPGVAPNLPHVPGIDCAGQVVSSDTDQLSPGQQVLVTGYGFGSSDWGGYASYARVPAEWVVPLPTGMTTREAMIYGTAGFTAAQCVMAICQKTSPSDGQVLVTGATGGVGSLSIAILAKLGYEVVAVTGKPDQSETLRALGAAQVVGREVLEDSLDRPLLKANWAAAVDTVGGKPLASLLRSISHRGVVAACGLVAGDQLNASVYPFLLRGITLAGIDSAQCPREPRLEIWRRIAGPWHVELPPEMITEVSLSGLENRIQLQLKGGLSGRTIVTPTVE